MFRCALSPFNKPVYYDEEALLFIPLVPPGSTSGLLHFMEEGDLTGPQGP